jgi:FAD/FMN-containing dehydrogenase
MVVSTPLRLDYGSWGGTFVADHFVERPALVEDVPNLLRTARTSVLAYGCGRSYGDVALNPQGTLIDCSGLDHFVSFDETNGVLVCEAGVQLASILEHVCRSTPGGAWFLPVSPGTRYITVGGAIANDVHGKNHHDAGTFGCHVIWLELARSDGAIVHCSLMQNKELFAATIGGLGLTGVIVRAALQLRRVAGLSLESEDIQFHNLSAFFELATTSELNWEYTAAWIDCGAGKSSTGRGIFTRARHVAHEWKPTASGGPWISVPTSPPWSLINHPTVSLFNALYYRRLGFSGKRRVKTPSTSVLYPLDAIGRWNRVYGPRGFFQFQCVVPTAAAATSMRDMLSLISTSGQGSVLSVLKTFGEVKSPGLMSFPRAGVTLALDFPNRGKRTIDLLARLEHIAIAAGGAVYPAKDALMTPDTFHASYPNLEQFRNFIDPKMSSAFALRVGLITQKIGPA